jgi:hypothetical protein
VQTDYFIGGFAGIEPGAQPYAIFSTFQKFSAIFSKLFDFCFDYKPTL